MATIKFLYKILTWPIWPPGQAPVKLRGEFVLSHEPPTDTLLNGLVAAYKQVFKETEYWAEDWPTEVILAKLQREVVPPRSFLTLMAGNNEWPVAGFAWGAKVGRKDLPNRIAPTLGKTEEELDDLVTVLARRGVKNLIYADEFGVMRKFQGGLEPVRGLLRPWLEWAWHAYRVHACMFWTTPSSPIYSLACKMGFRSVYSTEVERKEIVFLLNPDFRFLLKVVQNMGDREIARFLMAAERRKKPK